MTEYLVKLVNADTLAERIVHVIARDDRGAYYKALTGLSVRWFVDRIIGGVLA